MECIIFVPQIMAALGVVALSIVLAALVIQAVIPRVVIEMLRELGLSIAHHIMTALLNIKIK